MALTYSELTQAVKDYTENTETTFVNNIDNFIKTAEERIVRDTQLDVFRKNGTVAITSGNPVCSKPDDYLSSYAMSIESADKAVFLAQKELAFVKSYWPDDERTDVPRYYASYDIDNFYVAPSPQEDYTAALEYFAFPTSIVTAGETWIGNNASMPLLYGSLVEAYIFMKGELDLIEAYEAKYRDGIGSLKNFGYSLENDDEYKRGRKRGVRQ